MKYRYFLELEEYEVRELKKVCEAGTKGDNYFMIKLFSRKYKNKLENLLKEREG
jgi:hypothetical protein